MPSTLTYHGRLPGVVCQAALPPPPEPAIRLDVAGFAGFAERGPLHTPVLLEDPSQYRRVFGGDLAVAREGGRPIYAYLPGAVQAFFDNGGRRCYVVRVAGAGARPNRFRLPGLLAWGGGPLPQPVVAAAAWVGAWSDTMSVGTQLRAQPLRLYTPLGDECAHPPAPATRLRLHLETATATTVRPGDLLRLRYPGAEAPSVLFPVAAVQACGRPPAAGRGVPVAVDAERAALRAFLTAAGGRLPVAVAAARLGEAGLEAVLTAAPLAALPRAEGPGAALVLDPAASVQPGDLLRLEGPGGTVFWFPVQATDWQDAPGSPPAAGLRAVSRGVVLEWPAAALADPPAEVDLLSFDLRVREGDQTLESGSELRFAPGAEGWAGQLVTWEDGAAAGSPDLPPGTSTRLRAPAAAFGADPPLYLPLGMEELAGADTWAGPLPDPAPAGSPPAALPGKDGLDVFDPVPLFLDSALAWTGARDLLNEAEYLLYLSAAPRRLHALHSLLPVEEVALLAVPDLVHRPWHPAPPFPADVEPPPPPPPPPDWAHFQNCPLPVTAGPPPSTLPERAPCPPAFAAAPPPAPPPRDLPELDPPGGYSQAPLLNVQRALITLAAARADQVAILSLPGHFGARETLNWQAALTASGALRDGTILSYAAAYHPWPQYREEVTPEKAPLRATPPDGAVCGLIAAREHARGVWVAPANDPLLGVLGLEPALPAAAWPRLFDGQINLLHRQPGQFTIWSAHTLSLDPLLVQLSVRRLLIFLRKLCLRRGMQYVFESNNERFRRRVQAGFERALTVLMGQGALAAFVVSTGDELNTQNDRDNGRFLIALKIAPTLPIEFITVVLLRAGEDLLQVIER